MTDITAVVLTIGEETTIRAIESLERQTFLPKEIFLIKNVTPFHKALNLGALKVKTPFFIQVDSDMILDKNCLEDLRGHMTDNIGIAIGTLRDPLMGAISGVKMFRTECFERVQCRNSISSDTDFYAEIAKYGWWTIYFLNPRNTDQSSPLWHTSGEHSPVYTPLYTYSKYYLLGSRYRYRRSLEGLKWRFQQLQSSNHHASLIAQIAMAHGIFLEEQEDLLRPYSRNEDFNFLEYFLASEGSYDFGKVKIFPLSALRPEIEFENFYRLGVDLRRSNAFPAFKYFMAMLDETRDDFSWIGRVGLCHGIFSEAYSEKRIKMEYGMVREFL
jgi:hypothetical protein